MEKKTRFQDLKIEVGHAFSYNIYIHKNGRCVGTKITITRLGLGYEVFAKPDGYEYPIYRGKAKKTTTLDSVTAEIEKLVLEYVIFK